MPSNRDSTLPHWAGLKQFCAECSYAAVCPLVTLGSVENCEFVREQRMRDLDSMAAGGPRLLGPTPWSAAGTVIRERRGHKRELDYMNTRRGRRPLNEMGLQRLVRAVMDPGAVLIRSDSIAERSA